MKQGIYTVHMSYGDTAQWHTLRDKEYARKEQEKGRLKNVDPELTKYNVILKDSKPIHQVFNDLYKEEVDTYNKKQKRKDRKIDDYFKHVENAKGSKKQKTNYEYVLGFGNRDSHPEEIKEMLTQTYKRFVEDENMKKFFHVNYAAIHVDEPQGTPHLHINITPMAYNYKKGVSKQPGLNQATKQCFEKSGREYAYKDLLNHIKFDVMKEILEEHGYKCDVQKSVGKKHLNPEEYKEVEKAKKQKKKIENNIKNLQPVLEQKQTDNQNLNQTIEKNKTILQQQANTYEYNTNLINQQVDTWNKNANLINEQEAVLAEKKVNLESLRSSRKEKIESLQNKLAILNNKLLIQNQDWQNPVLQSKLNKQSQQIQRLNQETTNLNQQLNKQKAGLETYESELTKLKNELQSSIQSKQNLIGCAINFE